MDGETLMAAMSYPGYDAPLTLARYTELAPLTARALRQAGCTTVNRAAMFLAQIGAESGSLRWTEELADGRAYEGRTDLGNTQPGDGSRYKGRSFIQITGRTHYANLSKWAFTHGYVPTVTYFVDNPTALAVDRYAFLGPVWYWTVARPQLNALADAGEITAGTYAVNGGYNNLPGRTARWDKCLTLGAALLPPRPGPGVTLEDDDMPLMVDSDQSGNNPILIAGNTKVVIGHQKSIDGYKAAGVKTAVVAHDDYLKVRKGAS